MHGRGSGPSAPASDAAEHGDAGGTPQTARPCRVVPRGCAQLAPTRLKSGRLGPYRPYRPKPPKPPSQAEKKKKKKGGAKRTV